MNRSARSCIIVYLGQKQVLYLGPDEKQWLSQWICRDIIRDIHSLYQKYIYLLNQWYMMFFKIASEIHMTFNVCATTKVYEIQFAKWYILINPFHPYKRPLYLMKNVPTLLTPFREMNNLIQTFFPLMKVNMYELRGLHFSCEFWCCSVYFINISILLCRLLWFSLCKPYVANKQKVEEYNECLLLYFYSKISQVCQVGNNLNYLISIYVYPLLYCFFY